MIENLILYLILLAAIGLFGVIACILESFLGDSHDS